VAFSGVALIARDGQAIFAKGYGFANAQWRIPNDIKTKFHLGSITKQLTCPARPFRTSLAI
jgi:CubicO group peptidase (beta-lactamase class C family)